MDAQIDYSSSLIEEREQGIKEIESTMWVVSSQNLSVFFFCIFCVYFQTARRLEVNEIYRDLSTLVVEQGTILDRIDHNMEQTVVVTKKGIEELETAEKYQKSAQPIKCMLVLMVLIVVMTIVIVLRKTQS